MKIVRMRKDNDCAVAALATAAQVSYEEAEKALMRVDLPGDLESPVFENPENLRMAIERLGFKPINRTFNDITRGIAAKNKTIVLLHSPANPFLKQHWVVLEDVIPWRVSFHWGDGTVKGYTIDQFRVMFTKGFPNAAWEVGEFQGKKYLLQQVLDIFKRIFRR